MTIRTRSFKTDHYHNLITSGLTDLQARLYAARHIEEATQLEYHFSHLPNPRLLHGAMEAGALLADAIQQQAKIMIIADYDCDGACACALVMRVLRQLNAKVDFIVPDRFTLGYGLSCPIVDLAHQHQADLIMTVDNGIASIEGIAYAKSLGIKTLITDHHLPANQLPDADVIVNPNQPLCHFPSKALAGVGVAFYVMLALRSQLRQANFFDRHPEPNLAQLLDLVALATIADLVPLDQINRTLATQGLNRIRQGVMVEGLKALFQISSLSHHTVSAQDLSFKLAPKLNAAGRLADMAIGIECLISDDAQHALQLAKTLYQINQERQNIQQQMQKTALDTLKNINVEQTSVICLFDPQWHEGVIGIIAGQLKEKYHCPCFAFAPSQNEEIKGSGRSIEGFHLRDALDEISKCYPHLLQRFGGHAMAAGVTIKKNDYAIFQTTFTQLCQQKISDDLRQKIFWTDGTLTSAQMTMEVAQSLNQQIWGQSFPLPTFEGYFQVHQQKILKERHLKMQLCNSQGDYFEAIQFNQAHELPPKVHLVYRLDVNTYNNRNRLQLIIEHSEVD